MAVQLAAVGFVLKFVFAQTSPLWTLLVALVMVLVAGYELAQRQERRFARLVGLRSRQRDAAAGRRARHALRGGAW